MSNQATRNAKLLHADEEQLDRASIPISDGTAFVVLICPAEARAAALSRLRGRVKGFSLPDPVELGTPEEMLAALVEQAGRRDRVLSVVLGRDVDGALDAMNLHREKLLAGGPVLVWLEDVAALQRLRERAPDAYSFRSTLVLVRGDGGPLPLPSAEEPEAVAVARKRLKRARTALDKAATGLELAEHLRRLDKIEQAENLAREALLSLPIAKSDDEALLRGEACRAMALIARDQGAGSMALVWVQRALAEWASVPLNREIAPRINILTIWPGPFWGRDRVKAEEALALVNRFGLGPAEREMALDAMCKVALVQGDFPRARSLLRDANSSAHARGDRKHMQWGKLLAGDVREREGNFSDAEILYRQALPGALDHKFPIGAVAESMSDMYLLRGELDAVEEVVRGIATVHDARADSIRAVAIASVSCARGRIDEGLVVLKNLLHAEEQTRRDKFILETSTSMCSFAEAANEAGFLSPLQLASARAEINLAAEIILSIAGPNGPAWYPIQTRTLRAELLALTPDKLPDALTLDREALDLARQTYPDLLPETGRILADHLLLANQPDEALALIADIEPLALETGFLEERARLLANRILALVLKNEPPATLDPHLARLRESLDATGSKRITAETLRDLARRLPPTTTTPDPFALADEAHRLFLAMPMPAEEARCLEIMADVLVARGRPDEAKIRYRTARARLERHGLLLRVPKINEKLEKLG